MNRLRSQSFLLLGLLIWLGALRPASAQDGCTFLPQGFPGRDLLQQALDAVLAGACTDHDLCYRVCAASSIGLGNQKALCDLNFLFDTQSRCDDLAAQNAQLLRDHGVDPEDFRLGCRAAMLGVYLVIDSLWGPYYDDQCNTCKWFYWGIGSCDLSAEVCQQPLSWWCPVCSIDEANWCLSAGGSWDDFNCICTMRGCGEVDPYAIYECELNGGWFDEFSCLCWGDGASPVLIDLGGDGFHLAGLEQGVLFDIDGDGVSEPMGWTAAGSDDAFLVLDRNFNGSVDDGRELFGNFSAQPASASPNGFPALALFDRPEFGGNGDGRLTSADRVFPYLSLWLDADADAVAEPGELSSLAAGGVVEIDLAYKESRHRDGYGNELRYRAQVTFDDHRRSYAYDVFFAQPPR